MQKDNKNILRKFSGLSIITSGTLLLCGCRVVGTVSDDDVVVTNSNSESESVDVIDNGAHVSIYDSINIISQETDDELDSDYVKKIINKSYIEEAVDKLSAYVSSNKYTNNISESLENGSEIKVENPIICSDSSEYMNNFSEITEGNAFMYSDADEFKNQLKDPISEIGTYSYVDTYNEYVISQGDSLDKIASMFNTSKSILMEINDLKTESLDGISCIKYPIKEEYINVSSGTDLNKVAFQNGLDVVDILDLNDLSENDVVISKDSAILLHNFIGNENCYPTYYGYSNVIYNNKIWGDKIVFASGFSGASQKMIALSNSNFVYGTNNVIYYEFDGNGGYTSKVICSGAKDISIVDGIPVVYFRNDQDIVSLASNVNLPVNQIDFTQWVTNNICDYPINYDDNGNAFITFNGISFNNINVKVK